MDRVKGERLYWSDLLLPFLFSKFGSLAFGCLKATEDHCSHQSKKQGGISSWIIVCRITVREERERWHLTCRRIYKHVSSLSVVVSFRPLPSSATEREASTGPVGSQPQWRRSVIYVQWFCYDDYLSTSDQGGSGKYLMCPEPQNKMLSMVSHCITIFL